MEKIVTLAAEVLMLNVQSLKLVRILRCKLQVANY
jgi:hypothetical protein